MEELGIALCGTQPARIVRWVAQLANKPKPPARAAKQLVPARPLVFGFALLRRARIGLDKAATRASKAWASMAIGFFVLPRKLRSGDQVFSITLNGGSVLRVEPVPSSCGRALAAEGRTARADADSNFVALAPTRVGLLRWHANAFECGLLKAR